MRIIQEGVNVYGLTDLGKVNDARGGLLKERIIVSFTAGDRIDAQCDLSLQTCRTFTLSI
jgi:hypothetical protein